MDSVGLVSSAFEVQEYDLLSVKSETDECKFLHYEEKGDLSENLSDWKNSDSQVISRLVECPFCLWECKNHPDRLLQLLDHAQQIHRASMDTIAEFILERYQKLMSFMMNEYLKLLQAP